MPRALPAAVAGVLQGTRTYVLQDPNGNIELTHSISAGLDYAAIGPEHAWLHDSRRAEYAWIGDDDAAGGVSAAGARRGRSCPRSNQRTPSRMRFGLRAWMSRDEAILVNLSGRGDKDVLSVQHVLAPGAEGALMSRLANVFGALKRTGRGGLVTYLTAGDPDADRSAALLVAVARAGADVLEIGVPFSDPLADGPVIQRASERALAAGMTLTRRDRRRAPRARGGRHADRPVHLRESGDAHGGRARSRDRRRAPASMAC